MMIWCCGCNAEVDAESQSGLTIYPHRPDLSHKQFWQCLRCKNYVGCHPRGNIPLGNIPTPELRRARSHIHAVLDPLWKSKRVSRGTIYGHMSRELGYEYHTGEIRSIEDARRIFLIAKRVIAKLEEAA